MKINHQLGCSDRFITDFISYDLVRTCLFYKDNLLKISEGLSTYAPSLPFCLADTILLT
jgi:hypothetical protein